MVIRYRVFIDDVLIAFIEANAGWSKTTGLSSEQELKEKHVRIERVEVIANIPTIKLRA